MQHAALAVIACLVASPGTAWASTDLPADTVADAPKPAPAPEVAAPSRNTLPPNFAPPGPPRPGRMMMIVGWSVFGGSYALTAIYGLSIHSSTRLCDASGESCRRPGLHLLIPVVGPLFLIRDYAAIDSGPLVTATLMLFQTAGLAVGIAGTIMYVRDSKRRRLADALSGHLGRGVHLQAAPRLGGGTLQLFYRF